MKVTISRIEKDCKMILQESAEMAIITIHRPRQRNAMTKEMWEELARIGRRVVKNPKTKVVIIRGGQGQFTAGSDIKQFNRFTVEEAEESFQAMERAISTIEKIPLPTIAVVNGPAMGAGLELALACDLRIGTVEARLGMPIGRLGITLNHAFTNRLVQLIGKSRTLDLVYTGRILDAEEGYQLGMLNYLVPQDTDSSHFALKIAQQILAQSPASLKAVKRSVAYAQPSTSIQWETGTESSVDPVDFPEGVRAFVEKRKPNFKRRG
ncbi:enoyl-CoA hydratase-related protein [Alkalihalobacillus oceani]|uniref:enoyl-CoA hydratase/isomerase family protein n=1 Tax=Halalkalibacter oceani TaxID=1653776 RepID=UPI00203F9724|nr:enoyl-CoA hydratase-related protein [Halalkalibacter oceani]MCM3760116.1 enoyl-CoA hydratase-related protein [Halalkalibacter oceani]